MSIDDEIQAIAADFKKREAEIEKSEMRAAISKKSGDEIGLKVKCAEAIVDKEQGWLVDQFLPNDTLVIVAGQIGHGKTTACMSWAASISNGEVPIMGGKREARNVLMLSNEDSEAQLLRIFKRLRGDLSRLYVEDEDSDLPWGLADIPALEARIVEFHPALVIIDSLTTHKPSKVDLNSHGDVAPMLVALRKLAAAHVCAIVVIHHTNKIQTSDPLAKISGSIGISGTARHVILVASHPDDEACRVAAIAKTNIVKFGAPSYRFRLDPFGWDGQASLTAADILRTPSTDDAPDAVEIFLRSQLANGSKPIAELEALAEEVKISRDKLYRAKRRIHIVTARSGFPAKASWSLPQPQLQLLHGIHLPCTTATTVTTEIAPGELSNNNNNLKEPGQSSQPSHLSQSSHGDKGEATTAATTANEVEVTVGKGL